MRIVVLTYGWVLVGEYEAGDQEVIIRNASVIRRWGTTAGLGQLAADGPQPETVLDSCGGTVRAPVSALIMTIECEAQSWT